MYGPTTDSQSCCLGHGAGLWAAAVFASRRRCDHLDGVRRTKRRRANEGAQRRNTGVGVLSAEQG